jgi:hypothetical protein
MMLRSTSGVQAVYSQRCSKANPCSLGKTVSIYAPSFSPSDIVPSFQDVNQFSIITELLGTPPDDVIETIASENVGSTS